jgi:hypothetical protein
MGSFEFGAHALGLSFVDGANAHTVNGATALVALADLGI